RCAHPTRATTSGAPTTAAESAPTTGTSCSRREPASAATPAASPPSPANAPVPPQLRLTSRLASLRTCSAPLRTPSTAHHLPLSSASRAAWPRFAPAQLRLALRRSHPSPRLFPHPIAPVTLNVVQCERRIPRSRCAYRVAPVVRRDVDQHLPHRHVRRTQKCRA